MTFLCLCSLSFFKKQLLFVLWIFYDCKKKKARKANSHVRWLVMVGSCWCWCSRWLALYDWWLYGITERKPFFLVFVYSNSIGSTLSLSSMVGSYSFYASMTVTREFFSRSRVQDFIFSSFFLINIFSTLSFDEWIPWDIKF